VFCQLLKICQVFDIIHLSNSDLTYIKNLERDKIMFMPFHILKTYIRNPKIEIKLFLYPSTSSDTKECAAGTSVHICACGGSFSEHGINDNLRWETVGGFFCRLMTTWDGELLEILILLPFSSLLHILF
jgi:hypothetical protein